MDAHREKAHKLLTANIYFTMRIPWAVSPLLAAEAAAAPLMTVDLGGAREEQQF